MNWLTRLLRRRAPAPPPLKWRVQFASWTPMGGDPLLHYARCDAGTFEIYDDGSSFLLHFPRRLNLPAELFDSLAEAKAEASRPIIRRNEQL